MSSLFKMYLHVQENTQTLNFNAYNYLVCFLKWPGVGLKYRKGIESLPQTQFSNPNIFET